MSISNDIQLIVSQQCKKIAKSRKAGNSNELFVILNKSLTQENFSSKKEQEEKCKKAKSLAQTISQHAMSLRSLYLNNKINSSQISLSKVLQRERTSQEINLIALYLNDGASSIQETHVL